MAMIYLDEPIVDINEAANLFESIRSGWISSQGPFVEQFEQKFAEYVGVKYAKSCFSGTAALILLMPTLRIKPGEEVIIPSLTFSADAFAVTQAGGKVVFADCKPGKFTIDPDDVRRKVTKNTRAIAPTHLYGRPADMDELIKICDEHDIYLVEDCSQGQGATYKGRMVGSIGDFNVHSFHNKLIATGEGGMITTNDEEIAKRFDNLKTPPPVNVSDFNEISMNYRMSNLHAGIGLAQLARLEANIARKIEIAKMYDELFRNSSDIEIVEADDWTRSVYWRYTVVLREGIDRKRVMKECAANGFITREAYMPLHLHSLYRDPAVSLPHAERMGKYGLDIPTGVKLTNEQVELVAEKLRSIVRAAAH